MATDATIVFGVADAKISPLISESSSGAVYGDPIDVPGMKNVTISGSSSTKTLRGDNGLIAKRTVTEDIEVTIEFAQPDPQLFALMTGATLTEQLDGSWRVSLATGAQGGFFKLEAVSVDGHTPGSNNDVVFHKLMVTELPDMFGLVEEDFKTVSVTCTALPLRSTGDWMSAGYNATARVLADAPVTPDPEPEA